MFIVSCLLNIEPEGLSLCNFGYSVLLNAFLAKAFHLLSPLRLGNLLSNCILKSSSSSSTAVNQSFFNISSYGVLITSQLVRSCLCLFMESLLRLRSRRNVVHKFKDESTLVELSPKAIFKLLQ